jgi:hypothetical protein
MAELNAKDEQLSTGELATYGISPKQPDELNPVKNSEGPKKKENNDDTQ